MLEKLKRCVLLKMLISVSSKQFHCNIAHLIIVHVAF